jgi:hypothetical protein
MARLCFSLYNSNMIPIAIFVIVWLVLVAIFMITAILSIMQMMRFGVRGAETKWSIILFVGLAISVIIATLIFLSQIDLQSGLNLEPLLESVFPN